MHPGLNKAPVCTGGFVQQGNVIHRYNTTRKAHSPCGLWTLHKHWECDTHTHVIILHLHAHTHKLGLNGMTQNNHFHMHTCEYANLAWIIVLIIISPVCSASGGELFKLIAVDPIPENQAREVVWQLLEGVSHLHSFNVVHLDLKVCTPVNNMICEQLLDTSHCSNTSHNICQKHHGE